MTRTIHDLPESLVRAPRLDRGDCRRWARALALFAEEVRRGRVEYRRARRRREARTAALMDRGLG